MGFDDTGSILKREGRFKKKNWGKGISIRLVLLSSFFSSFQLAD
jgi:hypothetical protein